MKPLPAIIFFLLLSLFSKGQCGLSSLPKESKDSLLFFWRTLKEAQQQKDSSKLLSLCDFPFYVSQKIFLDNPPGNHDNYQLDSSNFMRYADQIFFEGHFKSAVSLYDDPTECLIFHGKFSKKGKKSCGYIFCYAFKNKKGKNEERCFSISLIGSSYKLESHWIRQ